jgi:hypothetical protein
MLQAVAEFLFEVIGPVICGVTGELILWVVTLGRRKPLEKVGDLSTLIGALFWGLIAVGIAMVFLL